MKVEVDVRHLIIPNSFMVAAPDIQKVGYVVLEFSRGDEKIQMDIGKGVALAVRDEINRVTKTR